MIFGRPERKKPQLGQPPAHLFLEESAHVRTASKLERLKDAVLRDKPHGQTLLQEYLDLFAGSLEDFRITYTREGGKPFDDLVVESITNFTPYRDNFVDFLLFATNYMNDAETYDRLFGFLEEIIPYKDRPQGISSWYEISSDNYRFFLYEMFLYLIAVLIKCRRFAEAVRFMDGEYHHTDAIGGTRYRNDGAEVFSGYVESLDEMPTTGCNLGRPASSPT